MAGPPTIINNPTGQTFTKSFGIPGFNPPIAPMVETLPPESAAAGGFGIAGQPMPGGGFFPGGSAVSGLFSDPSSGFVEGLGQPPITGSVAQSGDPNASFTFDPPSSGLDPGALANPSPDPTAPAVIPGASGNPVTQAQGAPAQYAQAVGLPQIGAFLGNWFVRLAVIAGGIVLVAAAAWSLSEQHSPALAKVLK